LELDAFGEHVIERVPAPRDGALRLVIQRDRAFSAGRRLSPPALLLDQLAHRMPAVADDRGRLAYRGRDDLVVDQHDAQVLPLDELFEHDVLRQRGGPAHGRFELLRIRDVHADAPPLLAARGLHDERAAAREKRFVLGARPGPPLLRHADADLAHHALRDQLVVAAAHRDGARQLAQRLPAHHAPAAALQREVAFLGVDDLDRDAAAYGLVDDDLRVRVELLVRL